MADTESWSCSCGYSGNKKNFCVVCGKPRPQVSDNQTQENELTKDNSISSQNSTIDEPSKVVRRRAKPQDVVTDPVILPKITTPKEVKENNNIQAIGVALIVGLLLMVVFFAVKDNDKAKNSSEPTVVSSDNATKVKEDAKPKREMQTDLSLGGLDLGNTLDEMHQLLGQEEKSKDMDTPGYKRYYFNDIWVVIHDNKVSALESNSGAVKTKRGFAQGSKISAVIDSYGKDYMLSNFGGKKLYEYNFQSMDGRPGILRFAVNEGADVVDYITVRYAPVEQSKKSTSNPDGAVLAMREYHKAITNHQYDKAYSMMTYDMQNAMGTFENYRKGYSTTLSSNVTDIKVLSTEGNKVRIAFNLRARDRASGGRVLVQNFSGTALMLNVNGNWHIDEMRASKQGEHYE